VLIAESAEKRTGLELQIDITHNFLRDSAGERVLECITKNEHILQFNVALNAISYDICANI
jgi:hypothetical protein